VKIVVVIPVYNEVRWLAVAVSRVLEVPPPRAGRGMEGDALCERSIVLVDDGSTDGTDRIVKELGEKPGIHAISHGVNRGKGAALRTGIGAALERGADVVIIHDADMEYDPWDHETALRPILDGRADAVIGSRFIGQTHRVLYFWHSIANRMITTFSNMLTNLNLTDIECCTKAATRDVMKRVTIEDDRFGVEPELVAKLAAMRLPSAEGERPLRIYEVPVSYAGRTYAEGKKIGWRDGVRALVAIVKYNLGWNRQ
jgi:glycosyltransferase involved in cell wall biosynthesis